jgi:LCP family protein required for cell wall assembly
VARGDRVLHGSASRAQRLFTVGLILLFVMIAGFAGFLVFDQVRQFIAASDVLPAFTMEEVGASDETGFQPGEPLPLWDGTERVNIVVLGIDQRSHEQGPWRTDSMMVLTVDPVTMSAGMLSVPRDLWVPSPGCEEGRIKTAHYLGDLYDYPGGGPALAAETVQYNFGVPIHHYVRVDFTAFEEVIDLIGGIDVYVEEEIVDPTYPDEAYGYDPLRIPAGWQHLDGELALKYARTRHSAGGDFSRARNQQQVLLAAFEKVTSLELLPKLAPRVPELWQTLDDSVVTDLNLRQVIALARLSSEVDPESIRYAVVDERYTQFWTTPDGQQVLIPIRDQIRELRDYLFTANVPLPEVSEPADRLAAEAATIEVLNGTGLEGLASETAEVLREGGMTVERVDNADRGDYTESLIIVYTGKTYSAEYLAGLLRLPPTAVLHGADPSAQHDISVVLGADYRPVSSGPVEVEATAQPTAQLEGQE